MQRLFVFLSLFLSLCVAGTLQAQNVSLVVPSISMYGYPWTVLAGSDRTAYVMPVAETDAITSWRGSPDTSGKNIVTFKARNNLSKGDVILIRNMTSPGQRFSFQKWQVASANPAQFTIEDGTTGSGTETSAYLQKIEGAGFTGKGTWEIIPTTSPTDGSPAETYRLYLQDGSADTGFLTHPILRDVVSHLAFTVGPVPGACYSTGSIQTGNRKQHSKIEFDLKFTSSDDSRQSAVMHYDVCANGGGYPYQGVAYVSPRYRQVFHDRCVPLAGQVFGNTNQMMDYAITQAPANGDARLIYPTFPQPAFCAGSVPGLYEITAYPHVDHSPGAAAKVGIWVSADNPPFANQDKVEQVPCDTRGIDPSQVFEVGPTQAHKSLLEIPQNLSGPLFVRIHNEGPPGSPTEFHEQVQINMPTGGSWDHLHPAFVACTVPNPATGELPILDAANAKTNSWTSPYVVGPYGLFSVNGTQAGPVFNDGKLKPFNTVLISGLHIRNLTNGFNYYDQNGDLQPWGGGVTIRPFGIQYWAVIGNRTENSSQPFFDDCNTQQSGWIACSLDTFYEGNHSEGYGIAHQPTEHMFYTQAFRDTVLLNLQDGVVQNGDGTAAYSDRGTRSFHMYNRMVPQPGYTTASGPGGHSEIQDAYNYILPDEFVGYQGAGDCRTTYATAPDCAGAFGGWDWFAALTEEHANSEFTIGNAYQSTSPGAKFLGIATTHNTTGIDNASQAFYAYNTFTVEATALERGQYFFEDTRLGARDNLNEQITPSVWPRAFLQNNIIPWKNNTTCSYTCSPFGLYGHALMSFKTNVVAPGQVTVAPNIQPSGWSAGGLFRNGVNTSYQIDGWNLRPINQNLGGFVQENFIAYNVYPVDSSMVPYANSNAKGAATALTGQLAYYPPRFNAVDAAMSPFTLRQDLTTAGAYDPGTALSSDIPASPPPVTTPPADPPPVTPPPVTPPPTTTPSRPVISTLPQSAPAAQWIQVGSENDTVQGKTGMTFRYGSHGGPGACGAVAQVPEGWITKTLQADGGVTANNNYFGADPAYCIVKVLELQITVQ